MAKIVENPNGGRRMIRLSSEDIGMVVSMVQHSFRGTMTYEDLNRQLTHSPFYLPEDV